MLVSKGLDGETRNIHIKLHFNKANHAITIGKKDVECGRVFQTPSTLIIAQEA